MKARLKFTKAGSMKFIGHLDVMRYFQKAFRRSGIKVAYSQGFSPHQLLSFAAPLGVGLTSDGEYLDMQLEDSDSSEVMLEKLNQVMNDEIRVVSFVGLPDDSKPAMSLVAAADYKVSLKDGYPLISDFQKKFQQFMQQSEILIIKKTKRSEKEINIKPYIYKYSFEAADFCRKESVAEQYNNSQILYLQLTTGSVVNIKPELVLQAFYQFIGEELLPFSYQIHRMEVYADVDKNAKSEEVPNPNRELIALDKLGVKI